MIRLKGWCGWQILYHNKLKQEEEAGVESCVRKKVEKQNEVRVGKNR